MPRREEGRFRARVKCLHCHGDGRPRETERWRRGQRTSNEARGPAVAWVTSVTASCGNPAFTGEKKGEEGWGFRGGVGLHSEGKKRQKQCDEMFRETNREEMCRCRGL